MKTIIFKELHIHSSHSRIRITKKRQNPILHRAGMSLKSHVETSLSRCGRWLNVVALEKPASTINKRVVATSNHIR